MEEWRDHTADSIQSVTRSGLARCVYDQASSAWTEQARWLGKSSPAACQNSRIVHCGPSRLKPQCRPKKGNKRQRTTAQPSSTPNYGEATAGPSPGHRKSTAADCGLPLDFTVMLSIDRLCFAAASPHLDGRSDPPTVTHERITSIGLGRKVRFSIRIDSVRC